MLPKEWSSRQEGCFRTGCAAGGHPRGTTGEGRVFGVAAGAALAGGADGEGAHAHGGRAGHVLPSEDDHPHDVQFTRGRSYKKDDNPHIEQNNWTHVPKLMGEARYAPRRRSRR